MGCMQPKGEAEICPHCGYHIEKQRNPMVLPYQAVLNNKFLIGRILGNPGGFGVTYLAWDLVLHTTVAIKEYFPRSLAMRDTDHSTIILHNAKEEEQFSHGLEQFLREARTLAQFSHPNIVRVREFFQQNNSAYLVMDYYEGVSLEEFVQRKGGKISEHLALSIMLPILDGLREVHQKKVLHRDIKPANIYLTKGDVPILLDFGAARFAIGQKSQALSVILTAGFAPFEQYLPEPGELLGPWTDIYACGATLYAITTGTFPQNAINRHQKDNLLSPSQIVPTLTPQLSRAIIAALTLDAEQRPQTIQAFQALLLSNEPIHHTHQSQVFASQKLPLFAIQEAATVPFSSKPDFTTQEQPTVSFQNTQSNTVAFTTEDDQATIALPNATTEKVFFAPQVILPAQESQQKAVIEATPSSFVRCPHCKARNRIISGQVYSKLHCQQCGKRMSSRPQTNSSMTSWKLMSLVIPVLILGIVIMKHDKTPESAAAVVTGNQIQPTPTIKPAKTAQEIETSHAENTPIQREARSAKFQEPDQAIRTERSWPPAEPPRNEPFPQNLANNQPPPPPEMAFEVCARKQDGDSCSSPGNPDGICGTLHTRLACLFKNAR
jgi:serine/threonine protein kinase